MQCLAGESKPSPPRQRAPAFCMCHCNLNAKTGKPALPVHETADRSRPPHP
jgi:hypothetical protein